MNLDIQRILEMASLAPSGENCQPWRFVVKGENVEQHLVPERDLSLYNWGQRASYFANGAALENLIIAASKHNYRATVTYFPSLDNQYHLATINLKKVLSNHVDHLSEYLEDRTTNRKKYTSIELSNSEKDSLLGAFNSVSCGSLKFIENRKLL